MAGNNSVSKPVTKKGPPKPSLLSQGWNGLKRLYQFWLAHRALILGTTAAFALPIAVLVAAGFIGMTFFPIATFAFMGAAVSFSIAGVSIATLVGASFGMQILALLGLAAVLGAAAVFFPGAAKNLLNRSVDFFTGKHDISVRVTPAQETVVKEVVKTPLDSESANIMNSAMMAYLLGAKLDECVPPEDLTTKAGDKFNQLNLDVSMNVDKLASNSKFVALAERVIQMRNFFEGKKDDMINTSSAKGSDQTAPSSGSSRS